MTTTCCTPPDCSNQRPRRGGGWARCGKYGWWSVGLLLILLFARVGCAQLGNCPGWYQELKRWARLQIAWQIRYAMEEEQRLAPPRSAATGRRLTIRPTDSVPWRDRHGKVSLMINMNAPLRELGNASPESIAATLLATALYEGAKQLHQSDRQPADALDLLLVDIVDMNEYGQGKGNWSKLAAMTVRVEGDLAWLANVAFTDQRLTMPAELPTIPFPPSDRSLLHTARSLRFWIPPEIPLVAGLPQTLFFEGLVTLPDPEEVRFAAEGAAMTFATPNRRGLVFSPQPGDIGRHRLRIKVSDLDRAAILEAETWVVVVAASSPPLPNHRPVRLLAVGHCYVDGWWPAHLADLLSAPGNPPFALVGSRKYNRGNSPRFRNHPPLDDLFHEGSGNFGVPGLLTYYEVGKTVPGLADRSPWVFKEEGKDPELDIPRYIREKLDGIPPDYILLNVGDNDAFKRFRPEDPPLVAAIEPALLVENMNELLDALRAAAPRSVIALLLPQLYNPTSRSFQLEYQGKRPRWPQLQNRTRFIELMVQLAATRSDLRLIPTHLAMDPVYGYEQDSAIHYNETGAQQVAAAVFAWLKRDWAQ